MLSDLSIWKILFFKSYYICLSKGYYHLCSTVLRGTTSWRTTRNFYFLSWNRFFPCASSSFMPVRVTIINKIVHCGLRSFDLFIYWSIWKTLFLKRCYMCFLELCRTFLSLKNMCTFHYVCNILFNHKKCEAFRKISFSALFHK